MAGNTITVRELSVLLGIDLSYRYHLLYAGRVLGEKGLDGKWRVDQASAFEYARRKRARQEWKVMRDQRRQERRERIAESSRLFQELRARV